MSDLDAARKGHIGVHACRVTEDMGVFESGVDIRSVVRECGDGLPCDASLFRDALDECQKHLSLNRDRDRVEAKRLWAAQDGYAAAERAITEALNERDTARALADELAEALVRVRRVADDCWCGTNNLIHTDDCLTARAALAKWEASK